MTMYRVPAFTKKSTVADRAGQRLSNDWVGDVYESVDDPPHEANIVEIVASRIRRPPVIIHQFTKSPIHQFSCPFSVVSALSGGMDMIRRPSSAVFLAAVFLLVLSAPSLIAAPVRLARHPDYHAGKITFSYLGDIWTANEDGTAVHRLTDNIAR